MPRHLMPLLALFFLLVSGARGAEPVSTGFWSSTAIGGRDTVSYHAPEARASHTALPGDQRFEVRYLGASWRFASRDSADRFAASPGAYVPRYNGHCANALSSGEGLVATDGTVWEFFGDRLHLFYAEAGRQRWLKGDWRTYQAQADAAWKEILEK